MNKELKHSIDFLNQKVGKNTGFSTPENYFQKVEENLSFINFVNSLPKEKAYITPTNYFESIDNSIFKRLASEKNKDIKIISLKERFFQYIPMAAAASVLLFIGINYLSTQKTTFDDITITDIESWFENGYGETYTEELATAINTSDIEDDLFASISDESLENYLLDSTTPLNDIE
ncbi:hypothetical protein C8N26_2144 [Tenacibaculum lutimaris]|uniref:Uncharacterized protein n=1 Tax=Tenacibaculum lutimaris TaxID=285258 RepID=A0A420DZ88_9FLAO|nr:hypothetical protein [Tenacibaculum lutimaris]RKF03154.1 hypothetical protein C8N26_2144 [Tenacibaculum lutimaris]